MVENLPCDISAFHYVRGNRIRSRAGSSSSLRGDDREHATQPQQLPTRRHRSVAAQPGDLNAGALAGHARTAGALGRRLRVRTGAGGRDQGGEIALSVAPAASAPRLAPLIPHPPRNQRRTAMIQPSLFLRRALLADAIFSGVSALALTFGAGAFAALFSLPEALLLESGLFLIAYAAFVGWLGTRQSMLKALALIVVAGNAAWTLASIALLFSGAVSPNLLGEIAVVAQAIATGVFAELQYVGLRNSSSAVVA